MTTKTLNSPPSRNMANDGSLAGAMRVVLDKFLQNTDDMLPARVLSYKRTSNMALVQPIIAIVTTNDQQVPRPQVTVPVLQLGGGGFFVSFPLAPGDLGWIKANDRDISLYLQTLKSSVPNTTRKHNFSDAVFIPDWMNRGVTIAGSDISNMVIQNAAGTVSLSISNNGIGINGAADAHAAFDIHSTTKAFLPPRMTQGQRDAIPSPVEGMVVYNLTAHALSVFNGSVWS